MNLTKLETLCKSWRYATDVLESELELRTRLWISRSYLISWCDGRSDKLDMLKFIVHRDTIRRELNLR